MNLPPHLNPKLFDKDLTASNAQAGIEQAPIRKGFGEGLLAAAEADERVVGLCADLTESTQMHLFAKKFPNRYVEMGIGEQSMASVASGMAAMGKIPFLTSYAMFSPGRNWEQIRTTICYNDRNVKIAGSHAGVSVGPDGGTHQAIEDIAITRVIPKMTVIVPGDSIEAKKATLAVAKLNGPVYIRLAREKTPIITTEDTPFEIGKAQTFFTPKDGLEPKVGIIATGALTYQSIIAAKDFENHGIGVSVLHLATIKPIDREGIINFAKLHKAIVTVEEHQVAGGMGSAVAELLSQAYPIKMKIIGVEDRFGQSGTPDELIAHYGLDTESIISRVKELL